MQRRHTSIPPQLLNIGSLFILLCLCLPFMANAQYEKPTLGIELRPVIPSDLFTNRTDGLNVGPRQFSYSPQFGFSGGAVMRFGLSKNWNLESGIYYTNRVYNTVMIDSGGKKITDKVSFDNYEVPVLGLIYIRLAKNVYLNNAFGLSLDFFPEDIQTPDNGYFYNKIARKYWLLPGLMANTGAEFRTESNGYFYIGASYHRMLLDIGQIGFNYLDSSTGGRGFTKTSLQGHYFALDFKFFFPTKRTPVINNGA